MLYDDLTNPAACFSPNEKLELLGMTNDQVAAGLVKLVSHILDLRDPPSAGQEILSAPVEDVVIQYPDSLDVTVTSD